MKTTALAVRSNLPCLEIEQVSSSSRNEIKNSKDNLCCMAGWVRSLTSKSLGEQDSTEGCVLGQAQPWYGWTEQWGWTQTHIKAGTSEVLVGTLWKSPELQQPDLLVRMLLGFWG